MAVRMRSPLFGMIPDDGRRSFDGRHVGGSTALRGDTPGRFPRASSLFDQYMQSNWQQKNMPPAQGSWKDFGGFMAFDAPKMGAGLLGGSSSTPAVDTGPVMGGGGGDGGYNGGGYGLGGLLGGYDDGLSVSPSGYGISGTPSAGFNTGLSNTQAGLLGGLLGIPGAGFLNSAINAAELGAVNTIGVGAPNGIAALGLGAADYGGSDSGIGSGPGGADGQAGGIGSSDAGSTGAGGDTGGEAGSGGDGTGSGGDTGGWAKGGKVTKKRLRGKNPPGPDDGYGALDVGELVVPAKVARTLSRTQIAGLMGRR